MLIPSGTRWGLSVTKTLVSLLKTGIIDASVGGCVIGACCVYGIGYTCLGNHAHVGHISCVITEIDAAIPRCRMNTDDVCESDGETMALPLFPHHAGDSLHVAKSEAS